MILLDTDHFSVVVDGRHSLHKHRVDRLEAVTDDVVLPVVCSMLGARKSDGIPVVPGMSAWDCRAAAIKHAGQSPPGSSLVQSFRIEGSFSWPLFRADFPGRVLVHQRIRKNRVRLQKNKEACGSCCRSSHPPAAARDWSMISADDFTETPIFFVRNSSM